LKVIGSSLKLKQIKIHSTRGEKYFSSAFAICYLLTLKYQLLIIYKLLLIQLCGSLKCLKSSWYTHKYSVKKIIGDYIFLLN